MKKFKVLEDNLGGLTLFVFGNDNSVEYAHTGYEFCPGQLTDDLRALKKGDDPKTDWEGDFETETYENNLLFRMSDDDFYNNMIEGIGYEVICDNEGIYTDKMNKSGKAEFCNH